MDEWADDGKVEYREEMINGLERSLAAFVGWLRGEASGKPVVKLAL